MPTITQSVFQPVKPEISSEEAAHRDPTGGYVQQAQDIFRALEQNIDPRTIVDIGESGFWGREDVIPHQVEREIAKLNSETLTGIEALNMLGRIYGPGEISVAREDAGLARQLGTRAFGRTPGSEEEGELLRQIIAEKQRRTGTSESATRGMQETTRFATPSKEELSGVPPEWMQAAFDQYPYMRNIWYEEGQEDVSGISYRPVSAVAEGRIVERDYGIAPIHNTTDPTKDDFIDPRALRQAKDVIDWLPYVERLPGGEGTTVNVIGPMLAANWNKNFGTDYKPEDFEVQVMESPRGEAKNRIMFKHPVTGKFTPINPYNLEWSDVIGLMPEAMLIGADVTGSIAGAAIGSLALQPIAGAALLGSVSTGYASWERNKIALTKSNYTLKPDGDWVSPDGKNTVRGGWDLFLSSFNIPEVYLSAGGNLAAPLVFSAIKRLVAKGGGISKEISDIVNPEEFVNAWNRWMKDAADDPMSIAAVTVNDLKQTPSASMVGDNWARVLQETADASGDQAERQLLEARAITARADAQTLRGLESGLPKATEAREAVAAEAAGAVLRQTEGRSLGADPVIRGDMAKEITPAAVRDVKVSRFGETVGGILEADVAQQNRIIADNIARNNATAAKFDAEISSPGMMEKFGERLQTAADEVIAASREIFDVAGQRLSGRGAAVPKPLNPAAVSRRYVDNVIDEGGPGAFPRGFIERWNQQLPKSLRPTRPKEGEDLLHAPKDLPDIPANRISYQRWVGTRDMIVEFMGKANPTQKRNLAKLREAWFDDVLLPAFDDDVAFAAHLKETNAAYEQMMDTWARGVVKSTKAGQYSQLANNLFKNNEKSHVDAFMADIWPKLDGNTQDLVRTAFKDKFAALSRGKGRVVEEGTPVSETIGIRRAPLGDDRVAVYDTDEAALLNFNDQNSNWIKSLFPERDGISAWQEVEQLVSSVGAQKAATRQAEKALNDLQKLPWLQSQSITLKNGQLRLNEPQRIIDDVFAAKSPKVAMDELIRILNRLPHQRTQRVAGVLTDKELAFQTLRTATFRKIFNPDGWAATAKATNAPTIENVGADAGAKAIAELKGNIATYNRLYGQTHVSNMIKFFRVFDAVANTPAGVTADAASLGAIKGGLRNLTGDVGLAGMKVYVGVLNRRARALTLGKKLLDKHFGTDFGSVLLDPAQLAKWMQFGRRSTIDRVAPGVILSSLGVSYGEPDDAEEIIAEFKEEVENVRGTTPPVQLQQSGIR
jgi:uncharacterized protein YozE (UPF0346 family)